MTYDVFISFKNSGKDGASTPDAKAARRVYEALRTQDIKVFFSEESLAEVGKSHFSKPIEQAIESARVLVLVASCREHIESRWVEAEWDSFAQDIRSGNKEGELFIVNCGNLKPTDLPLFLRRQQMFHEDDLQKLVKFVGSALPARTTVADLIRLSLHCFQPEKNEDKVYLMTVHEGSGAGKFNVTAHWGARSAKRLSSQMKAVNVNDEAARAEVEQAQQEKLRGGYKPVPHTKIITPAALSFLSASLGFSAEPAPMAANDAAPKRKEKGKSTASPAPKAPLPVASRDAKAERVASKPTATPPVRRDSKAEKVAPKSAGKPRRFEFIEGTSAKFWEISVSGAVVKVRFGRLGTEGQTRDKTLSDAAAAQAHAGKMIAEKLKEGYRERGAGTAVSPPAAKSKASGSMPAQKRVAPTGVARSKTSLAALKAAASTTVAKKTVQGKVATKRASAPKAKKPATAKK